MRDRRVTTAEVSVPVEWLDRATWRMPALEKLSAPTPKEGAWLLEFAVGGPPLPLYLTLAATRVPVAGSCLSDGAQFRRSLRVQETVTSLRIRPRLGTLGMPS